MSGPLHTDRGRAESFGSVAADYDRYRPTYPDALIDDIVVVGGRTVLDVGCGTGRAARLFAARGLDVTGIEIDPMMAEIARSHGIEVEVSSFEGWADGGRRFDLLTSGQAWHWVDPDPGVPKAAELVRPGGAVAVFWNHDRMTGSTQAELDAIYAELAPELVVEQMPGRSGERPELASFAASPAFDPVEVRSYPWQRRMSADEWVGMCFTYSNHVRLPAARRSALAARLHAAITAQGGITVEYDTYAIVAYRVAA